MRIIRSFIIAIFLAPLFVYSQENLVPNNSFEIGQNNKVPSCATKNSCSVDEDFDDRISDWRSADPHPNCPTICIKGDNFGCVKPTPDWIDVVSCSTFSNFQKKPPTYCPSNRFVGLYKENNSRPEEGVRVTLREKLRVGKKYILRLRMAVNKNDLPKTVQLRLHLTKFDRNWNDKPRKNGNKEMKDFVNFSIPANSPHKWYNKEVIFSIDNDKDNVLENLIILTHYNNPFDTYLFVDDVELYEYCPAEILIENRKYSYEEPRLEAGVIKAGFDVGAPTTNGDVVVQNGTDVTYKAAQQVVLKPGFSVTKGGEFHAYIAACGSECPAPVANGGEDITICDGTCRTLGGFPTYQQTYSWTAYPPSAIAYLSDPNTLNPKFCPPPTGHGVIKYTLKGVNKCGESATKTVVVRYDNQPNSTPTVNVANILFGDIISFDVISGPQVDEVQIKVCNTANTVCRTFTYRRDIDFPCCSFRWRINEYLTLCDDYIITVSARNLCDNNIAATTVNWNRDRTIRVTKVPNVYFPSTGPYCVNVTGAEKYSIMVFNRNGSSILFRGGGEVKGHDFVCMWNGTCNFSSPLCKYGEKVVDGTYQIILQFSNGCGGFFNAPYFVQVFNNKPSMKMDEADSLFSKSENYYSDVRLYPNPNQGSFTVFPTDINQSVELLDMLGHQLLSPEKSRDGIFEIDISDRPKGVYFVKVSNPDGSVTVKKVVYQ